MIKKLTVLSILIGSSIVSLAQELDSWNVYPSFSTVNSIAISDERIFVATLGGIFIVRNNEIVSQITTLDGLYRSNPSSIMFDSEQNNLIAGYIDGTIDVVNIDTGEIIRIEDINRVSRFNSKSINAFEIYEDRLYVATAFGIVVYDLDNFFVENSFLQLGALDIGAGVNDFDIVADTIYVATMQGIAYGDLNTNLVVSSNWTNVTEQDGLPGNMIDQIKNFDSQINILFDGSIYRENNGNWNLNTDFPSTGILSLQKNKNQQQLAAASESSIIIAETDGSYSTINLDIESSITDILLQQESIYVGTTNEGLLIVKSGGSEIQNYLPTGPYLNFFSNLLYEDQKLAATSTLSFPSIDPFNPIRGYYIFAEDEWQNYNINTDNRLSGYSTAYSIGSTDSAFYIGSWGQGIVRHNKYTNSISVYDRENSNLVGIGDNPSYVVISGLGSDSENNIWAVSYLSEFPLNVQMEDSDEWIPFRSNTGSDLYFNLFVDSFDQKWISLINSSNVGQGLYILDTGNPEDSNDDRGVKLSSSTNNGNLPDEKINSIIQDKNGEVWIGTSRGIARFIFPELVIEGGPDERQAQWLINEDTSAVSRFLLRDVSVSAMAVNDANQKWIGSINQGIWLLNAEGSRILKRFTTENSNLISNNINSISIDNETGEVFIATELGLVSYFDIPKAPVSKMNSLKVFPNPFQYSRHQQIVIEGLSESTAIKVLGIDGIVVNELTARGGRISWDGYDYNGNKLGTGVYFLIAFEESGRETGIGKVVIAK